MRLSGSTASLDFRYPHSAYQHYGVRGYRSHLWGQQSQSFCHSPRGSQVARLDFPAEKDSTLKRSRRRLQLMLREPGWSAPKLLPKMSESGLLEPGWRRGRLLPRQATIDVPSGHSLPEARPVAKASSNQELGPGRQGSLEAHVEPFLSAAASDADMKPPGNTESDFDAILASPQLRKPFQEFLEQQFCAENLNFYLFVEQFRGTGAGERAAVGKKLFDAHFAANATEPVNVDSTAMNLIKAAVASNDFREDVFNTAQYQIFNLMRFDCWPRFLKSDLNVAGGTSNTLEKKGSLRGKPPNRDEPKESKRKSLLPWKVMRSRKKESAAGSGGSASARGGNPTPVSSFLGVDGEGGNEKKTGWRALKQHSMPSNIVDSVGPGVGAQRGSEAGLVKAGPPVCILVGLDESRATIALADSAISTRAWLRELCAARGIEPANVELIDQRGEVLLAARDSSPGGLAVSTLANRTLRLSKLVEFRLEIPLPATANPSSSSQPPQRQVKELLVRARGDSVSGSVLRSVVAKYGVSLESLVVGVSGTAEILPASAPIAKAAGKRLYLITQTEFNELMDSEGGSPRARRFPSVSSGSSRAGSPASFLPLPQGAAMLELPPRNSTLAVPMPPKEEFRLASTSLSTPSMSEESGMLKYVRKGAPLAVRKSLDSNRARKGEEHGDATTSKRQTVANSEELRIQMQQDNALSELMSRTGPGLDDQRAGGALRNLELPEFLREANTSWEEAHLDPDLRPEDGETDPRKADALFGPVPEADFADPGMTERRTLGDYGFESAESSFVTAPCTPTLTRQQPPPLAERPPPPAYPGPGRLCTGNMDPGSRTPVIYLSPHGPGSRPTEATLLKADYV